MCRFLYVCVSMCVCVCVKLYKQRGFVYSPVGGGSAGQTVVCCRLLLLCHVILIIVQQYMLLYLQCFPTIVLYFFTGFCNYFEAWHSSLSSFVVVVVVVAVALFHLAANYL